MAVTADRCGPFASVTDLGGRDINGSPRLLFPGARYVAVDVVPGPGVDVVADARTWVPEQPVDCVVCCEVLEHVPDPDRFVAAAWEALKPGGLLVVTAACPPRAPHSAADGGQLRPGEFYRNVDPYLLARWLIGWKDAEIETHEDRGDVYATARKPD